MKKVTQSLIAKFKTHLIEDEKSSATLEKYMRDINAFAKWLYEREADKKTVLEYKEYLMQNHAHSSVNSILSSLNSFFDFIGWYDAKVKTIKIQKQIFANKEKELSKSEYERLLNAAKSKNNQRLFYLLQTICSTGIRVSEVKFITIEALKLKKAIIQCKGKMRIVILPKELCKILSAYAKEEKISTGPVFITKHGKPLDRSNIWKLMKSLCESAKVAKEKVFPHNLRHLFARTFYQLQKDIVRLADILGHSSINTTRIYTMENGDEHRRQIQKLGLLLC